MDRKGSILRADAGNCLAFPEEEYKDRLWRLQGRMRGLQLDVALVSCRTNLRWLTGFASPLIASRLRSFVSVVSVSGGVTLVVPPDVFTAATGYLDQLRRWQPDQHTCTKAVLECIHDIVGTKKTRIGVELGWGSRLEMCQHEARDIQTGLGGSEIVDIAQTMWNLRACKTPAEVEKVARACAITDQALTELFPKWEAGLSEREVENMWVRRMVELGGEQAFTDVEAGPERVFWANNNSRPGRIIEANDIVYCDGGCTFDGYSCDLSRSWVIKRPRDSVLRIIEGIVAANRVMTARLAPGLPAREVHRVCREEMRKHGLEGILNRQGVGHSVGLDLHEPPEIAPDSADPLFECMTMCIEPWSVDPEDGLFNVEDVVAMNGSEVRRLTTLPQGIYCVEEQRWYCEQ